MASNTLVLVTALRQFACAVLALFAFVSGGAYAQDRRVALVVGNSAYKSSPLPNPVNDAKAMSAALRKQGFEVIERENVSREGFATAAREFGDRLRGASVALFYYAGHGLQVRGRNFLVPVDADIAREDEVPYRSVDVNEILDKMDSARTPINVVMLDACRNNPFARSFKLSQVGLAQMDAPAGTLIAFATSPGSVAQDGEGDNGLYTSAVLRHMATEGLPIEQLLKRVRVDVARASNNGQVPWESSSLNRDFSFAQSVRANPVPREPAVPTLTTASELAVDLAFWDAIKTSTAASDYKAYLDQFPQGRFAALARSRSQPLPNPRTQGLPAFVAPALTTSASAPLPGGKVVRGFADGHLEFTGLIDRPQPIAVALGTQAAVQALAVSPDAMVVAAVSGDLLSFVDARQATLAKSYRLPNSADWQAQSALFSANGRWLLVSGLRGTQELIRVVVVSTGAIVLEKQAIAGEFAQDAPRVELRLRDGRADTVELR